MIPSKLLSRNWRVLVVGILGTCVAFGGSFVLTETYTSTTRLLIRGRDATFLTTSAEDLSRAPGVIDASMAKSLAETQGGIATSRDVATRVVDQLHLDAPEEDKTGPVAWTARVVGGTYARVRAFLTFGYHRDADPREKAIATVQEGVEVHQLGAKSGGGTGQPSSYVIELVAAGESPQQAHDIAEAAADALVEVNAQRFRDDARRNADFLGAQVARARAAVDARANEVRDYKVSHGISDIETAQVENARSADALREALRRTEADLQGARARVAVLDAQLAATPPTQTGGQRIESGRSTTGVVTDSPNPVHQELQGQSAQARADAAALEAERAALEQQLGAGTPGSLNEDQAALLQLQQQLDLAQKNLDRLTEQHEQALLTAEQNTIELTRIDDASTPTYPIAPKRYLYLALGLLIGGLAGGALTWLAQRRLPVPGAPEGDEDPDATALAEGELDLRQGRVGEDRPRELVGAGNGGGAGRGSLFER